jgi:methylation protein EvaC
MTRTKCRVCDASLGAFMSFGQMPLANAFVRPEHLGHEYFFELAPEGVLGVDTPGVFQRFKRACEANRQETRALLMNLKQSGKRIAGYAAAAKSTTVLNYCGLGADVIDYIADVTPIKQGTLSPGMHIPVRDIQHFRDNPPDYAVIFAWNHQGEIMAKERWFTEQGGQWIVLRPEVHLRTQKAS